MGQPRRLRYRSSALLQNSLPIPPTLEDVPTWDESGLTTDSDPALIQGDMQTIQNVMWHYVGLVRSGERLSRAIRELRHMQNEIETFYRRTKLSDGLIGLRNAVEVALICGPGRPPQSPEPRLPLPRGRSSGGRPAVINGKFSYSFVRILDRR